MDFDWKSIVGAIAPVLGTALLGPFGGIAAKVLSAEVLGDESASAEDLKAAIAGANPETVAKIKQAEYVFLARMEEAGVKREQIASEDRDSARKREIALKDRAPAVIGGLVLLGFFVTLATLVMVDLPTTAQDAFMLLAGGLIVMAKDVISYYFGSSAGSKRKTEIFAKKSN